MLYRYMISPKCSMLVEGGNGAEEEAMWDPRLTYNQHILFQFKKWLKPKKITFKNLDGETLWIAMVFTVVRTW